MQANYVQRIRLTFSKIGPTRYIGHLDLARTLERALNRAQISVAYTQGFNRRPRMQFAAALPLGMTSESELADIWLESSMEPEELRRQLMSRMAPGIVIHRVEEVPLSETALQNNTLSADYTAHIGRLLAPETLRDRVTQFIAQTSIMRERRGKRYDLRPLVLLLERRESHDGDQDLVMSLSLLPDATGRPDEVLDSLGIDPLDILIHRTAIHLAKVAVEL